MSDQSGVSSEASETAPAAPEAPPAEAPAPAAPTPSPDFERIYARMDELGTQQQQIAEQLGAAFAEPEEEPDYYDETGELTEEGVRSVVADYVREQLEEQLAPRERAAAIESRDGEWEALKESYPELANREVANAVIGDAMRWANANNPDLIDTPQFVDVIEWVYRARKYDESVASQEEQPTSRVVLESATGAARSKGPTEPDWGERIVKAAERLRPQI